MVDKILEETELLKMKIRAMEQSEDVSLGYMIKPLGYMID